MTNLIILQENNLTNLEKTIKHLEQNTQAVLGVFLQFDGTYVLQQNPNLADKYKLYACQSSIEHRSINVPQNCTATSLGKLHQLCEQADNITVLGNLT